MNTTPLRIIFAGTPDFAAASLQALIDNQQANQYEIVAVYTQPDRPAGRGQKLVASPVKQLAQSNGITVEQPVNFKEAQEIMKLEEYKADIMVVAAYGIILPKKVLDTPKLGCINVHASILPRWRGAAPIHRAILAGDTQTGITIMQMDVGLDTGDMLLKVFCDIEDCDTSASLHDKLAPLGGQALIEALEKIKTQTVQAESQNESLTCYAAKLTKHEGDIPWQQTSTYIDRHIRGLSPWPTAFSQTQAGVMKVHKAQVSHSDDKLAGKPGTIIKSDKEGLLVKTNDSAILIKEIQFAGSKRMSVQDALNGKHKAAILVGQELLSQESAGNS
ncbi:methionyl-tRNA formyltransferase [Marinomonas epiphytica]